jgi:ATP-dependent Clp protease adapter protein ClpS
MANIAVEEFVGSLVNTAVIEDPEVSDSNTRGGRGDWLVTVFNNDYNTYEQVMNILVIATECSMDEAFMETWEVDHLGKSVVHQGSEKECLRVASIIATIGIRVDVSKDA